MSKKGPLSKGDKLYIEQNYGESSSKSIADSLDRSVATVEKHIRKHLSMVGKAGSMIPSSKGGTVMTEAASQMSDDFRQNRGPVVSPKIAGCVTTAKKE